MIKTISVASFFNGITQLFIAALGLLASPYIVNGLGLNSYGVYTIMLVILGSSVLFDLGLGKALVKYSAEYLQNKQREVFANIFWSFFVFQILIGIVVGFLVYFFSVYISNYLFTSQEDESIVKAIKCIGILIPVILITSSLRSIFEGLLFFKFVNILKFIINSITFIIPVFLINLGIKSIYSIIFFILVLRIIILTFLIVALFKELPFLLNRKYKYQKVNLKIVKFTGGVAITNILVPVIGQLDKFLLSNYGGPELLTFYTLPIDLINGIYIIPNSLVIVLYPMLSQSLGDKQKMGKLVDYSFRLLLLIMFPISILLSIFSFEILQIWQGELVATNGGFVLEMLAITIPITSISWIFSSAILAMGNSRILAINLFFQLLIFSPFIYFSISYYGISGACYAIFLRLLFEGFIYIVLGNNLLNEGNINKIKPLWLLLFVSMSLIYSFYSFYREVSLIYKFIFALTIILCFFFYFYFSLISKGERKQLKNLIIFR